MNTSFRKENRHDRRRRGSGDGDQQRNEAARLRELNRCCLESSIKKTESVLNQMADELAVYGPSDDISDPKLRDQWLRACFLEKELRRLNLRWLHQRRWLSVLGRKDGLKIPFLPPGHSEWKKKIRWVR